MYLALGTTLVNLFPDSTNVAEHQRCMTADVVNVACHGEMTIHNSSQITNFGNTGFNALAKWGIFDKGGYRVNRDVRWRTSVLDWLQTNLLERKKA